MNKPKFTPGPWRVHDDQVVAKSWSEDPDHYYVIAGDFDHDGWIDSGVPDANARLIAAAPDLYDALEMLVGWLSHPHNEHIEYWQQARRALAKARGENA